MAEAMYGGGYSGEPKVEQNNAGSSDKTNNYVDIIGKIGTHSIDEESSQAGFAGTICTVQDASTISEQLVKPIYPDMPVDRAVRATREAIDQMNRNLGEQAISEIEPKFGE